MNNPLKFSNLSVGDAYEFSVTITDALVADFAALSGDVNPLHTDDIYAQTTPFKQKIAHGMIAGALFSRLVGMHLPGLYSVYLSQTLQFREPVAIGADVVVSGKITEKSEGSRSIVIATEVRNAAGRPCVTGEARVKLLQ